MSNQIQQNLGDAVFGDIDSNSFLNEIYDNILYNYAIKVSNNDERKMREVDVVSALRFADLLSKSTHAFYRDKHKMWAQEIIILLYSLYPNNPDIKFYAGSILTNIGNHQVQKKINSDFYGATLLERFFIEYQNDYLTIPSTPELRFFAAQKITYDHLSDEYFSYSYPASMDKTYVIRMFIKNQIINMRRENYAIIVPTTVQINEVRTKIEKDLNNLLFDNNYYVTTSILDIKSSTNNNQIFIMTPGRFLHLLTFVKDVKIDYLFIDEAQKLLSDDPNCTYYYELIQKISEHNHYIQSISESKSLTQSIGKSNSVTLINNKSNPYTHIIFSSPIVPNPQICFKSMSGVETNTFDKHAFATIYSPIIRVNFLINLETQEISAYNEHSKSIVPITTVTIPDTELDSFLFKFEHENSQTKQRIVYFSSSKTAIDTAVRFAQKRFAKTDNPELIELAKEIKKKIHGDYDLAELVLKGVAYYVEYLPSPILERIENLFRNGTITTLFCSSMLLISENLPSDNFFITDFKKDLSYMSTIEFHDLIGRIGSLDDNIIENVFFVAKNDEAFEKYVSLLKEDVPDQSLSLETKLTDDQKRHIIKTFLSGKTVIEKLSTNQTLNSYNLMRNFSIILFNDINNDRQSVVRSEFSKFMQPEDEVQIRNQFSERLIKSDDDVFLSFDQVEALYHAIIYEKLNYPFIRNNGHYNSRVLFNFLEKLCTIFNWELYESDTLGYVDNISKKHSKLKWYSFILCQWVNGLEINKIIVKAIEQKKKHPKNAIYIENKYVDYLDSIEHNNLIISDVLKVIDNIILDKFEKYFFEFSKVLLTEIGLTNHNDLFQNIRFRTTNDTSIELQLSGFSKNSATYILRYGNKYITGFHPHIELHSSILSCPNANVRNEARIIQSHSPDLFKN